MAARVYDRFIPVRSAIDFGSVLSDLTWATAAAGSSSFPYGGRRRLLAFNNVGASSKGDLSLLYSSSLAGGKTTTMAADRVLDASGLKDDANSNLMDWGSTNQLAVALGGTVYLLTVSSEDNCNSSRYVDEIEAGGDGEVVSCVSWAPDGHHIAIGVENSIQLWDCRCSSLVRTLRDRLGSRVGAMSWNGNIISSGGSDGSVVISDPRLENSAVCVYITRSSTVPRGHLRRGGGRKGICGLSWSNTGHQLASGCSDGLAYIWDARSQTTWHPWIHRFVGGDAANDSGVRAIAWCPFRDSLLATGGGAAAAGRIKFWSTRTGNCINTLSTGSGPVHALLWSKSGHHIISSSSAGGGGGGMMAIWDYTSLSMTRNLIGHTHRVLYLAQSPDGCRIASAAGGADETLRFSNAEGSSHGWPLYRFLSHSNQHKMPIQSSWTRYCL